MNATKTLLTLTCVAGLGAAAGAQDLCISTAEFQLRSATFELREEFLEGVAACLNIADPGDRDECLQEVRSDFIEGQQLMLEQYDARVDLCDKLGGGIYDPDIDPADFVSVIDNPYMPFPVGAQWNYEADTEDGFEEVQVTVLPGTRTIMGVECVSVQDTVTLDGVFLEDTTDWFAQDVDGNVWYFGEISINYDEDGFIEDVDGSWIAGVDGAKPGIVMPAAPQVDQTYRQEWLLGEAEDAGTILDLDASIGLGIGTFNGCIQTEDFTPVEPDALEHKYYAPGIGFIFEFKPDDGEMLELVSYSGV